MKAYRIELLVVDHDNVGDDMVTTIEEARYPNRCINPQVMSIEARDIGEWDDDHPLNHGDKAPDEFKRLFSAAATTPPQEVAGQTEDFLRGWNAHRMQALAERGAPTGAAAQPAEVPEGFALVPVEPTKEMLDAYVAQDGRFHSARSDWAAMLAAAPTQPAAAVQATEALTKQLMSALNGMLTFFGMDEDESSKPTFDAARQAHELARITTRPLEPHERAALTHLRATLHGWHERAAALGADGVDDVLHAAEVAKRRGELRAVDGFIAEWKFPPATPQPTGEPAAVPSAGNETLQQKNERNARVQARYDELMREGKRGHYETLFKVVREEIERAAPPTQAEAQVDAALLDWAQDNLLFVHQDMGQEFSITFLRRDGGRDTVAGKNIRECLDAARAKDKTK